jgi:hypothetical protein
MLFKQENIFYMHRFVQWLRTGLTRTGTDQNQNCLYWIFMVGTVPLAFRTVLVSGQFWFVMGMWGRHRDE